jgi:hypothetical protein
VGSSDPAALAASVVQEIGEDELPPGTLFQVRARQAGVRAPAHAQPLMTSLREHPEVLLSPGLLRTVATAVPHGRAPEYKKWKV